MSDTNVVPAPHAGAPQQQPADKPQPPADKPQPPADTQPTIPGAIVPESATLPGGGTVPEGTTLPGGGTVPAGVFLRFIAFLIDYVGFIALYAVVWVPVVVAVGVDPATLTSAGASGTVLAVVYMSIMEGARGTTVGKMVCRLRVTMADGSALDWKAAVLRNVFKMLALLLWVLGLVVTLVAMLNSPTAQRTGDRVAGTLVVRDVPAVTHSVPPASAVAERASHKEQP